MYKLLILLLLLFIVVLIPNFGSDKKTTSGFSSNPTQTINATTPTQIINQVLTITPTPTQPSLKIQNRVRNEFELDN